MTSLLTVTRMLTPVAWSQDAWVPQDEVVLHLDDLGFLQGACIVDRLRTCGGKLVDLERHASRFDLGCRKLGIVLDGADSVAELVSQCVAMNLKAHNGVDFSVVVLATPGRTSDARHPTFIIHTLPIPWIRLQQFYTLGQPIVLGEIQNVPAACWAPQIKTRSRLHYYLADRAASQTGPENTLAVLLDADGNVTDTSISNVLIVEGHKLVSPPLETILNGVSLQRVRLLAKELSIPFVEEPISAERAVNAEQILLSGSTGLLWPAASLDNRIFDAPADSKIYKSLSQAYIDSLGFDFVAQALALT